MFEKCARLLGWPAQPVIDQAGVGGEGQAFGGGHPSLVQGPPLDVSKSKRYWLLPGTPVTCSFSLSSMERGTLRTLSAVSWVRVC